MDEEVPPFRWEDVEIPADVEVTVRPDVCVIKFC